MSMTGFRNTWLSSTSSRRFPTTCSSNFGTPHPWGRSSTRWFLGVQLEQIPDNLRARAISYWDRRLAAAKASATPARFRREIGSIGQFFFHKGIPGEWLMDQVLAVSDAGFGPVEPCRRMNWLGDILPNLPSHCASRV